MWRVGEGETWRYGEEEMKKPTPTFRLGL